FAAAPSALRVTLRTPGENRPRVTVGLASKTKLTQSVTLPEGVLADAHGTLLATIVGEIDGENVESPPACVIQESQLTFEAGEGSPSPKRRIEECGEGLPAYLDELGKREGAAAVIEYLSHLTIRFDDGSGGGSGLRRFRLRIRDPFIHDDAPPWL